MEKMFIINTHGWALLRKFPGIWTNFQLMHSWFVDRKLTLILSESVATTFLEVIQENGQLNKQQQNLHGHKIVAAEDKKYYSNQQRQEFKILYKIITKIYNQYLFTIAIQHLYIYLHEHSVVCWIPVSNMAYKQSSQSSNMLTFTHQNECISTAMLK